MLRSPGWVVAPSFDFARKQPEKHVFLAMPLPRILAKALFLASSVYFSGATEVRLQVSGEAVGRKACCLAVREVNTSA